VYELCILGELMDAPAHGYRLHRIVQTSIGPVRKLSWGTLYPMIRRLEAEGLIVADDADGEDVDRRRKKEYRITAAGRARLVDLMLECRDSDAELSEVFTIKLSNLHHVSPDQRATILQQYLGQVRHVAAYVQSVSHRIGESLEMAEAERQSILCALDHRMHLLIADDRWVSAKILEITRGSQPAASTE
jgi:DNA-binding PadR family transcriptional regulator